MNNQEIFNKIDQTGAHVERLFFLPLHYESSSFTEFLEDDLDDDDIQEIFPEIDSDEIEEYRDMQELRNLFYNHGKCGFFADVRFPERSDFRFNERCANPEDYSSCSVNHGIQSVRYLYSETIEDLVVKIEATAKEIVIEQIKRFKAKNLI